MTVFGRYIVFEIPTLCKTNFDFTTGFSVAGVTMVFGELLQYTTHQLLSTLVPKSFDYQFMATLD